MNQFRIFLRMERKTALAWTVGSSAYVLLMGILFVVMGGGDGLQELIDSYPSEILDAFGGQDIGNPVGFLNAEFGAFAPLVYGIFLLMLISKHLSGAQESGRIDHVMARPLSRKQYYWSLLGAALVVFLVLLVGLILSAVLGFLGEASGREMLGLVGFMVDLVPYALLMIGLGGLLGSLFHQRAKGNILGAIVVALSFLLDMAARLSSDLEALAWVTPIGLLGKSNLADGDPSAVYWLVSMGLAAIFAFLGARVWDRKQLVA